MFLFFWFRFIFVGGSDRVSLVFIFGVLEMRCFLIGRFVLLVCVVLISFCISVRGVFKFFFIFI